MEAYGRTGSSAHTEIMDGRSVQETGNCGCGWFERRAVQEAGHYECEVLTK